MASDSEKTQRIGFLCLTMVALGGLLFLAKTDTCSSCNASTCRDEFYAFEATNNPTCTQGARAEIVTSPPAPKAGVLCHCPPVQGKLVAPTPPVASESNLKIDAGP